MKTTFFVVKRPDGTILPHYHSRSMPALYTKRGTATSVIKNGHRNGVPKGSYVMAVQLVSPEVEE